MTTDAIRRMMARLGLSSIGALASRVGCDRVTLYHGAESGHVSRPALRALMAHAMRDEWEDLLAVEAWHTLAPLPLSPKARLRAARAIAEEAAEMDFDATFDVVENDNGRA